MSRLICWFCVSGRGVVSGRNCLGTSAESAEVHQSTAATITVILIKPFLFWVSRALTIAPSALSLRHLWLRHCRHLCCDIGIGPRLVKALYHYSQKPRCLNRPGR